MSTGRGPGRRKIDREMGSYLRDIEESLRDIAQRYIDAWEAKITGGGDE